MSNFCLLNHNNNTFLYANSLDSFVQSLPASRDIWGLPSKKISHSHIALFEKILSGSEFIFIDVGAYLGTISLLLSSHFQRNNIFCPFYLFEPNIKNLLCLEKSILANNLNHVHLSPKAISDYIGESSFSIKDNSYVTGRLTHKKNDNKVSVTTLDNEIAFIINKNIIIKVDTEGNEPNVIRGMTSLLKNNNCILVLEIHPFCLNIPINQEEDLFQFISKRFDMIAIKNIGYPSVMRIIKSREELEKQCTREGVTDLLCLPKQRNYDHIR